MRWLLVLAAACGRHPSDACKSAVETARARVADAKAHYVEPTTPVVTTPVDGIGRDATAHVVVVRGDGKSAFGHFDRSAEVELIGSEQIEALASAVANAADIRPGAIEVEIAPAVDGALARVTIDLGFPRYEVGWDAVRLRSYPPRFDQRSGAAAEDVIARIAKLSPSQRQDAVLP